jgi:hypothetical protein
VLIACGHLDVPPSRSIQSFRASMALLA